MKTKIKINGLVLINRFVDALCYCLGFAAGVCFILGVIYAVESLFKIVF